MNFRSNTKKKADILGIRGYIKNLSDGSVEMVAWGQKEKVDELIQYCKNGPDRARVHAAEVKEIEAKQPFIDFKIKQ